MDTHPNPHPTPETLEAFGLGQFDDVQAEAIARHLEDCPECRQRVAEAAPDTFLDRLRDAQARPEAPAPRQAEPTFDPLAGGSPMVSDDTQTAVGDGPDGAGLQPGTRIGYFGDYELLRVLGEGGMGIVYKARQLSLNRSVALKTIRAARFPSADEVRRFHNEAEAVARLDHPNIVPIFEVGRYEDQHYFSMKLIGGESLDKRLKDYLADPRRAARLVAMTADAIHHAHQRSILHRDLKPANILVDSDGQPHVTDFGLAKRVEVDSELTRSGAILGTPAYMAPEQASGKRGAVTTSTDVYGLGALLYALLVGRAPFGGTTVLDTLEQVRERPPASPKKLNPRVPRNLEVICLKCLEKDPHRRYASADALAEDLRRWLAGEPIAARRVGKSVRIWMWSRRNPLLAGALSAAGLLLIMLTIGSLWAAYHFKRLAESEQFARRQGDRRLAVINFERGKAACEKGDIASGLLWFIECWRLANAAGDPTWPRLARRNIAAWQRHIPRLKAVFPPNVTFRGTGIRPDGKAILGLSDDSTVQVWDVATSAPTGPPLRHRGKVLSATFSPDARTILTTSSDLGNHPVRENHHGDSVRLWDAATAALVSKPLDFPGTILTATFSPDGAKAFVSESVTPVGQDALDSLRRNRQFQNPNRHESITTVRLWDTSIGAPVAKPFVCAPEGRVVAISPDGKIVLAGSEDKALQLWDIVSGKPIGQPLPRRLGTLRNVAFSADGKTMLFNGDSGDARLWDVATGQPIGQPLPRRTGLGEPTISPDGKTILASDSSGKARFWDVTTGEPIGQPLSFDLLGFLRVGPTNNVAFSPDSKTIVTGSSEKAQRWDVATGQAIGQPLSFPLETPSLDVGTDTRNVLITGPRGMYQWDAALSTPIGRPFPYEGSLSTVVFSSEGKRVLIAGRLGYGSTPRAQLWDTATGRPIGRPLEPFSHFQRVLTLMMVVGPNDRTVLTAGMDGTATLWDASTGQPIAGPISHQLMINAAAFSPDGRMVLTGSVDKTARLWDTTSSRPIGAPMIHGGAVLSVAFSRDGKVALTGGRDSTARRWDAATGQPIGKPLVCPEHVCAVSFSPDGKVIITECVDGSRREWDTATGTAVAPARIGIGKHPMQPPATNDESLAVPGRRRLLPRDFAISPDGQVIMAQGEDNKVWILDAVTKHAFGPPLIEQGPERSQFSAQFSPDGKIILVASYGDGLGLSEDPNRVRPWRLWTIPDVPNDFARIAAWVAVQTGLELDDYGLSRPMDHSAWQGRREQLQSLGGPPPATQDQTGDPILYGPDPLARARAWMDRKRWAEAEAALNDVVAAWPEFGPFWFERGRFYVARSRREEAGASFARAFELGVRDSKFIAEIVADDTIFDRVLSLSPGHEASLWLFRSETLAERGQNVEAEDAIARVRELPLAVPERISLRLRLARLYERLGLWSRAAGEFAALSELTSDNWSVADFSITQTWSVAHDLAINRLLAGDLACYRSTCATMLQRIDTQAKLRRVDLQSGIPSYAAGQVVDACLCAPDAVTNLPALVQATEWDARPSQGRKEGVVVAALYRAGRYREALDRSARSRRIFDQFPRDWLFLAMIHSRLGHPEEARRLLADANRWMADADKSPPATGVDTRQPHWGSVLRRHTAHLLRGEAEALILYDPVFPADPFAN